MRVDLALSDLLAVVDDGIGYIFYGREGVPVGRWPEPATR